MHLRVEINIVTLHKVVETTAQQTRSVIKAKGGCATYFFGRVVHYILYLFSVVLTPYWEFFYFFVHISL